MDGLSWPELACWRHMREGQVKRVIYARVAPGLTDAELASQCDSLIGMAEQDGTVRTVELMEVPFQSRSVRRRGYTLRYDEQYDIATNSVRGVLYMGYEVVGGMDGDRQDAVDE